MPNQDGNGPRWQQTIVLTEKETEDLNKDGWQRCNRRREQKRDHGGERWSRISADGKIIYRVYR